MPSEEAVLENADSESTKEQEQINQTMCDECGDLYPSDEINSYEVYRSNDTVLIELCNQCRADKYNECIRCAVLVKKGTEILDHNDNVYCPKCFMENFFTCDNCGESYHRRYATRIHNGDIVCRSCREDEYTLCDGCGEYYPHEDCYDGFCLTCSRNLPSEEEEEEGWREYTSISDSNNVGILKKVGLEIEMENVTSGEANSILQNNYLDRIGIVSDGSVSKGVEFVFPPIHRDAPIFTNLVNNFYDIARKSEWVAGKSCGVHVHVKLRQETIDNYRDLMILMGICAIHEACIIAPYLPNYRKNCNFAYFLGNGGASTQTQIVNGIKTAIVDSDVPEEVFNIAWYGNSTADNSNSKWSGSRYRGFNFHSVKHRGTLEIRHHHAIRTPETILAWTEYLAKLINKAEKEGIKYFLRCLRLTKGLYDNKMDVMKRAGKLLKTLDLSETTYKFIMNKINERFCKNGYKPIIDIKWYRRIRQRQKEAKKLAVVC